MLKKKNISTACLKNTKLKPDWTKCQCVKAFNRTSPFTRDILIKNIKNLANKEEVYYEKKQIITDYLEGKTEYSDLEVAVAELYTLVFSFNFMRGSWRSNQNYLKYEDPLRRLKAKRSMEAFESILHFHMPLVLCELYEKWQNVNLIHGSFMDYKHSKGNLKRSDFLHLTFSHLGRVFMFLILISLVN